MLVNFAFTHLGFRLVSSLEIWNHPWFLPTILWVCRFGTLKNGAGWVKKKSWMGKKSAGWVKGSTGWVKKKCWMGKKEVLDG